MCHALNAFTVCPVNRKIFTDVSLRPVCSSWCRTNGAFDWRKISHAHAKGFTIKTANRFSRSKIQKAKSIFCLHHTCHAVCIAQNWSRCMLVSGARDKMLYGAALNMHAEPIRFIIEWWAVLNKYIHGEQETMQVAQTIFATTTNCFRYLPSHTFGLENLPQFKILDYFFVLFMCSGKRSIDRVRVRGGYQFVVS